MLTLKDYVNWGLTHCDKVESAEGVPLVLENCVKNKKMKQLEVYGNSVQKGTPTPENPIEVESVGEKCTKNLFEVEQFEAELQHGYILNDAGEKTIDHISTYSSYRIPIYKDQTVCIKGWFQRFYVFNADDVFVMRSINYAERLMNTQYTPTEDGYIRLQIRNATYNANKGKEQIESGSVATEYEPYGKFKIPVTVRGKNLIPLSSRLANNYSEYSVSGTSYTIRGNVGAGRLQATTGQLMFPSLYNIETYGMEVTAGKTYRIAFDYLLKERGAYDNYISLIIYGTSNAVRLTNGYVKGVVGETISHNFSFTSEYDEKVCLCFRINNNLVTLSDIRFEDADVEPITTNVYLDEPLRKIGDYADVLDFKGKKVVRKVNEHIMTGKESLSRFSGSYPYIFLNVGEAGYVVDDACLSNQLIHQSGFSVSREGVNKFRVFNSYSNVSARIVFRIYVDDVAVTNESHVKALLKEKYDNNAPLVFYYVLSEPYEEPIECELPILTAKTSVIEIGTSIEPSNIKGKYIKK